MVYIPAWVSSISDDSGKLISSFVCVCGDWARIEFQRGN